jgi:signal transduction histidine kinase/DNA-binding response OmpR family regulator
MQPERRDTAEGEASLEAEPPKTIPDAGEAASSADPVAERTRGLVGVTAITWVLFTMLGGYWSLRLFLLRAFGTLAVALLYLVVRRWPSSSRSVAHLTVLVSLVGITGVALLTGNVRSPAMWYLVCAPLFAGYLLGPRAAFGWAGGAAVAVAVVEASRRYFPLHADQEITDAQLWVRALMLVLVVLAFSYLTIRVHGEQLAKLAHREALIRNLAEGLGKKNDELCQARDSALAASRAKGEFLAMMSHEIRTPLNGVLGLAGVLLDGQLATEQREIVRTIRTSGDSLLLLLNDILDFSKIEAGRLQLERAPFDVVDCAEDAVDLFAAVAHEKGLDLSCHISSDVPARCEGDSGRVRQILVNLVSNAIKFTLRGSVQVLVDAEPLSVGQGDADTRVHCSVKDTGIGIPEDHLVNLFRPFSQVDASTTRRFGGTGLGLAICRTLAERMGGRVWAESKKGAGSTFHFTFSARSLQAISMSDSAHGGDHAALVVSPREGTRGSVASQLAGLGLQVQACARAGEVKEALASLRPDVLVVDETVSLLEMQGALAKMHRAPAFVVLSTAGRDTAARRALREKWGPEPIIVAIPVRRGALQDAILHALGIDETPLPRSSGVPPLANDLPLRILIAEDNPVNQRVALLLLERLGYRADVVGNGAEAVEAVHARPYDLVLMDVRMPEVDGIEATRRIRAELPKDRQPRVIALTANAMTEDRKVCEAAGMDDFLSKPVTAKELERALRGARGRTPVGRDSSLGAKEIDALRRLTEGSPEVMRQLIDDFIETAHRLVTAMYDAAENGDAKALERAAHSLKGSSGQMGAQQLMFECAAIEGAAAVGDLASARERFPSLEKKHHGAKTKLAALRDAVVI